MAENANQAQNNQSSEEGEGSSERIKLSVAGTKPPLRPIGFVYLKMNETLEKMMKVYAYIVGLPDNSISFRFKGHVISFDDTPAKLGMKDQDKVEAFTLVA